MSEEIIIQEPHLNASLVLAAATLYLVVWYGTKNLHQRGSMLSYTLLGIIAMIIAFYAGITFIPQAYPL